MSADCTHPGQRQHGRPAAHSCPQTWCSVLKAVSGTMTKVQKLGEVTSKAGSLVACSHRGCSPGSLLPSACGRCFSAEARPNSRTRTPHFDLAQGPHRTNSAAGAPRPTRDLVHFGAPPPTLTRTDTQTEVWKVPENTGGAQAKPNAAQPSLTGDTLVSFLLASQPASKERRQCHCCP